MKYTCPDYQIEISVAEVIELLKFNEANKPQIYYRLSDIPLPVLDEALHKATHLFEESEAEPKPKQNKSSAKKPKKKTTGNAKSVQVLFENGWKTFKSVSQAAEAIGTKLNHLSHAMLNGKTCNGHEVRYANNKGQPETASEEPADLPQ